MELQSSSIGHYATVLVQLAPGSPAKQFQRACGFVHDVQRLSNDEQRFSVFLELIQAFHAQALSKKELVEKSIELFMQFDEGAVQLVADLLDLAVATPGDMTDLFGHPGHFAKECHFTVL